MSSQNPNTSLNEQRPKTRPETHLETAQRTPLSTHPLTSSEGLNDLSAEDATSKRSKYRTCPPDHTRIRLHVSYDGTDFSGWQRQTSQPSIQGTLEKAISKISGKEIYVLGASRTDAGVHANRQVAHFDYPKNPEVFDLRYAVQCLLPNSIVIKELFIAPPDFHSIALSTDKIYKYRVVNRKVPSALRSRYAHWVRFPLNLDFLNEASSIIVGNQDFKAFQSTGTVVQTTIRNVTEAYWTQFDEDTLEFTIRGEGFLKQMVRTIVGTLIELNQRGEPAKRVREILDTLDRRKAGATAPAQGLFLCRVNYPEDVDNRCRKL